ncbi:hypothetical protein D3C87_127200 [compost metagenome]
MYKTIATILFLIFFNPAFGQDRFEKLQTQISNLKTPEEIEAFWLTINQLDQDPSASATPDVTLPLYNLYAVSLLIEKFGYPTNSQYGYPIYTTPWLVWTHTGIPELEQYTFPIILKGKDLNELPPDRYPNYFVGGFLLGNYGFDMEFDPDLNTGDNAVILSCQRMLEKANHTVDPSKVLSMIRQYIKTLSYKEKQTLGPWTFMEHGAKKTFSIVKRDDNEWYLKTQLEGRSAVYRRIKNTDKSLKKFEYLSGFKMFYLTVSDNNKLQLRDLKGNIKKESE